MMSFVQQHPKDCLLDRKERCQEALHPSNTDGDGGGVGGSGGGCGGGGGSGNERFFHSLRTQLLRIRVARLLRQDFALDKQLVELKALCGEVSTKLETDVSQELWAVVSRQGRLSGPQRTVQGSSVPPISAAHLGQLQDSSLAQDAATVLLARELLRRAAGVAVSSSNRSSRSNANCPVRNDRSSYQWHSHQPPLTPFNPWKGPPVSPSFPFRGHSEGEQSSAELPRRDFKSHDDPLTSADNITPLSPAPSPAPSPVPSLVPPYAAAAAAVPAASTQSSPDTRPLLVGKVATADTVGACLGFVVAGKEAARFDRAKKTRFGPTVDRAPAAGETSIWRRNEALSLQPKSRLNIPLSSKRVGFHGDNGEGEAEIKEPRSPASDIGPRDKTGGGGLGVTLSAQGAQATVCLSPCPSWRFGGSQVVNTAAALDMRHAVEGGGVIDGDPCRARSPELLKRIESHDEQSILHRSEEGHHQEPLQVPPRCPRPQVFMTYCQAPSPPPLPPSPRPPSGVSCVPQKKTFGEKVQRNIGQRQKPCGAQTCEFGTGVKTCEDIRDVTPPFSVPAAMDRGVDGRSYTDPRANTQVLGGGYDSRIPCKPPSVNYLAGSVRSSLLDSGGGNAGRRSPRCCRSCDGFQNENYTIPGAPRRAPETANSSLTPRQSATVTGQKLEVHRAGYRRRYRCRQRDGGDACQLDAGDNKTERQPLQSADGHTDDSNREASRTHRCLTPAGSTESDAEMVDMTEDRAYESSCALARKRALVRVRLARHQNILAAAVADANERCFRAERRRQREEKVAALLLKTCGFGVGGGSRHHERRTLNSQGENDGSERDGESGNSPAGVRYSRTHRKKKKRPTKGMAFAMSPVLPWSPDQDTLPPLADGGSLRHNNPGSGDLRHSNTGSGDLRPPSPIVIGEGSREEEGEYPRQPLKVVPVKSKMPVCRLRSTRRADDNDYSRPRGDDAPAASTQQAQAQQDRDSHSWARFSDTTPSSISTAPSSIGTTTSSPLVVLLDDLHALPGRRSYFGGGLGGGGASGGGAGGGGLFAWDEPGVGAGVYLVLEAGGLKHQTAVRLPAYAASDVCRATNTAQEGGGGGGGRNAWVADGKSNIADWKEVDEAWVFRETVVLQPTATIVGCEPALLENRLCVRVFARDERLAHDSTEVAAANSGRLVGVATLPLGRLVVRGVGDESSKQACECTFSRPVEVSVLSVEGVPIGWLGLSICGV